MTKIGVLRERYSREVEPAPSMFTEAYTEWAKRADAWGEKQELTVYFCQEHNCGGTVPCSVCK